MESAGLPQQYQEIEYSETVNELKPTENIEAGDDPQTTERNMGGMLMSQQDAHNSALKSAGGGDDSVGNYGGFMQAPGDDGDTERRHFSSLPSSN